LRDKLLAQTVEAYSIQTGFAKFFGEDAEVKRDERSTVKSQQSTVYGQRSTVNGQRSTVSGQWAVGSGQWAVGSGQWAVGSGQPRRWPVASLQFKAGWSAEQNFLDFLLSPAELSDLDAFSSRPSGKSQDFQQTGLPG
jgi:hypothetical protein